MSLSVSFSTSGPLSSAFPTGKRLSAASGEKESVETQFLKLAKQSPVERMRGAILKKMGLTEEDLQAMDPKTRAEIEKTIREEIARQLKEQCEQSSGLLTDLNA
jgi:TPP-dependent pyruvate/acetoin dehydrogenase alpha subunit